MGSSVTQKSILMIAGEASGDVHGGSLIREIRKRLPDVRVYGIGGDRMKAEGFEIVRHVREMSFLGFIEVARHLPFIRRVFREMAFVLEEKKPDLVLLIDYPGFNLRFAKRVKNRGIPVLYYISPQVWAWGRRRVKTIARRVDRMIVLFPFEEALYRSEGMDVRFVGHPLKDAVRAERSKEALFSELGIEPGRPTIGLFPGSRRQEVESLLPKMIEAYGILRRKLPGLQAVVGMAATLSDDVYRPFLDNVSVVPVRDRTYDVMAHSDAVMVASGTATLETAILGTPMVILYRMSPLTYFLGRLVVKVGNIGLVNIVAGRRVVPELLQRSVRGKRIASEVFDLLSNAERRKKMIRDLLEVSNKLGEDGAAGRAADSVVEFMEMMKSAG